MSDAPEEKSLTRRNAPVSLAPRTMDEALVFAEKLAESSLVPKDMQGKPANVFLAIQMGAEVGLAPMMALQSIAVINGRPSLWGDGLLALVRASGLLEEFEETFDDSTMTATCVAKRKGAKNARVSKFSWADAENVVQTVWENGNRVRRKLTEKDTYRSYPKRMLAMRARTFALRDEFADVLRGMTSREELEDSEPIEIDVTPAARAAAAPINDLMPKPKASAEQPDPPATSEPITAEQFVDGMDDDLPDASTDPRARAEGRERWAEHVAAGEQARREDAAAARAASSQESSPATVGPAQPPAELVINEDKRRALFAEARKSGKSVGDVKVYLQQQHGIDSTKAIPEAKFDEVFAWCKRPPTREPGQEG